MLITQRTMINILKGGRSATKNIRELSTDPKRLFKTFYLTPLGIKIFLYCSSITALPVRLSEPILSH